jgi:hypothetical protein
MFDSFAGLPLHPLVVHAVVVLLPLTCIGAIAIAMVPRWDAKYGFLVLACAIVAAGSAFVAMKSGNALASRVGIPTQHQSIAKWVPWLAALLLIVVAALWWLDRRFEGARSTLLKVLAGATIVIALVNLGWVIRAGDTGARTIWGTTIDTTTPGGG